MSFLDHQMKGDILPPFLEPASLALYLFSHLQFKAASSSSCPFLLFFALFLPPECPLQFCPRSATWLLCWPDPGGEAAPTLPVAYPAALLLKLPAVCCSSCWPANSPTPPLPPSLPPPSWLPSLPGRNLPPPPPPAIRIPPTPGCMCRVESGPVRLFGRGKPR